MLLSTEKKSDMTLSRRTAPTFILRAPAYEVVLINDVPALRIERFDCGTREPGAVHHCVSAATALDLAPAYDVEDPRRSRSLRLKLKRPGEGLEPFRRVIFSGVVGNTDDPSWNSSLRQLGLSEWELSPLYVVAPFLPAVTRLCSGCQP